MLQNELKWNRLVQITSFDYDRPIEIKSKFQRSLALRFSLSLILTISCYNDSCTLASEWPFSLCLSVCVCVIVLDGCIFPLHTGSNQQEGIEKEHMLAHIHTRAYTYRAWAIGITSSVRVSVCCVWENPTTNAPWKWENNKHGRRTNIWRRQRRKSSIWQFTSQTKPMLFAIEAFSSC